MGCRQLTGKGTSTGNGAGIEEGKTMQRRDEPATRDGLIQAVCSRLAANETPTPAQTRALLRYLAATELENDLLRSALADATDALEDALLSISRESDLTLGGVTADEVIPAELEIFFSERATR